MPAKAGIRQSAGSQSKARASMATGSSAVADDDGLGTLRRRLGDNSLRRRINLRHQRLGRLARNAVGPATIRRWIASPRIPTFLPLAPRRLQATIAEWQDLSQAFASSISLPSSPGRWR